MLWFDWRNPCNTFEKALIYIVENSILKVPTIKFMPKKGYEKPPYVRGVGRNVSKDDKFYFGGQQHSIHFFQKKEQSAHTGCSFFDTILIPKSIFSIILPPKNTD